MTISKHFDCCHITIEVSLTHETPDPEKNRSALEMSVDVLHLQAHPECLVAQEAS